MLSIIIPAYNQHDTTYDCIQIIRETTGVECEIILIDNGSTPPIQPQFTGFIITKLIRNETNLGFPAAINQGIRAATGDIICLLNNDVAVTPGWAEKLIDGLEQYDIVGPCTNYVAGLQKAEAEPYQTKDGLFQSAKDWSDTFQDATQEVNFVIGFCMAFKKSLYDELGDFDESLWPCSGEEIDFCFRTREAGRKIGIVLGCYVHHEGSQTFKDMEDAGQVEYESLCRRNDAHLAKKWGADFWTKQVVEFEPGDNIRLNLGCGRFKMAGFVNVDQYESVNPDLLCDATALPYKIGTVDEIYCGHMLEHMDYHEGQAALKYWHCLLKSGGKITVTVPDIDVLMKQYLINPTPEKLIEMNEVYIYSYFQQSIHKYCYSEALLRQALSDAGFVYLKRLPQDHKYFIDPVNWQVGVEAVKP